MGDGRCGNWNWTLFSWGYFPFGKVVGKMTDFAWGTGTTGHTRCFHWEISCWKRTMEIRPFSEWISTWKCPTGFQKTFDAGRGCIAVYATEIELLRVPLISKSKQTSSFLKDVQGQRSRTHQVPEQAGKWTGFLLFWLLRLSHLNRLPLQFSYVRWSSRWIIPGVGGLTGFHILLVYSSCCGRACWSVWSPVD